MPPQALPIPPHFKPQKVGEIWRVPYQVLANAARTWAKTYEIRPASQDTLRICLVLVDIQNTFCIPGFELYVGGTSGSAAVDDNRRLCTFIYQNLHHLTQMVPTMDTHQAMQIFHSLFLVNENGDHPTPFSNITVDDIRAGRWRFNPDITNHVQISSTYGQRHLEHYALSLEESGKYALSIWPYHAMLGGVGHALVPAIEEAMFFHTIARYSQPEFRIKGNHALTEHYSVLGPEVEYGPDGERLAPPDHTIFQILVDFDAIIITGQAKSHCVAWTIEDLLQIVMTHDRRLAEKVYLLEDCTSPIVTPDGVDFTREADAAFARFAEAGMHLVCSTDPIETWPDLSLD